MFCVSVMHYFHDDDDNYEEKEDNDAAQFHVHPLCMTQTSKASGR